MRHVLGSFMVVVAIAGCGKEAEKKQDKPTPTPTPTEQPKDAAEEPKPAKPPKGQATVDLTLTGAVEKKFSGPIGECQIPIISGKPVGATYQVREADVELVILATSEDEIKAPKVLVNVGGGGSNGASFALSKKAKMAKLEPGKSAEIEATLGQIGKKETVTVKGTFACNPD